METTANTPVTNPAPLSAKPKAKVRQTPVQRFPFRFHCSITPAMADSFKRLTANNSLKAEADVGRDAFHHYFLAVDPAYRHAVTGRA
jgi:hypothetical protein